VIVAQGVRWEMHRDGRRGSHTVEWAVFTAAMVLAAAAMATYPRDTLRAMIKKIEMMLNGGTLDNRP
jgi:hypothetical protein